MAVMASWNGKTWGVSSQRIAALNGVSSSVELDTENSDDKAGSPATKTKALKLQSMSFDFDLASAVGATPEESLSRGRRWSGSMPPSICRPALRPGKPSAHRRQPLRHHTRQPRPDPEGKITINLTEYAEEASSKKAGAGGSSKSSSAAASRPLAASAGV